MKVTLFIPAMNEAEGLRMVMPRVKKDWVDQILVVDGQSTDGTAEYARKEGYDVHIQREKGLRKAYSEGWPLIRGDVVVTFSPDGNCIPELIPALIEKMKGGFDMVIVSRYLDGAKSEDDTWMTRFGNWFFTHVLINGLHGGHYTDAIGIYRAYKTKIFYDLDMHKEETYTPEKFWFTVGGIEQLLSTRALKRRLKIVEIPGDEPKRVTGYTKLRSIQWGGAYFFQIIRELWYWR